jgi:DNA-binding NarL/FixJ family response regulator
MRVVLVDDHRSFREAFKLAVAELTSVTVVGEAGSAREAIPLVHSTQPDLVVVDLCLEDWDGIALANELRRQGSTAPIMILSMHGNGLFVREALEAGVRGYAVKDQPLSEIVEAMRLCVSGQQYLSPMVRPVPGVVPGHTANANGNGETFLQRLSQREQEIAARVIRGESSRAIAELLCISLKTVETHRGHINRKLGVHSTAELIRLAAMTGTLAWQLSSGAPDPALDSVPLVPRPAGGRSFKAS